MIKFKYLKFSNIFSYGEDNYIELDQSTLTQLVGKNGNGKSSIALILEEGLFNTNSKKIKKSDVINRYTKSKSYNIEVSFEKDLVPYIVITNRTATAGIVKLLKAGIDISSHTATGTYKQIEHILGFDHKTFSQIVYQSSVSSLEFLTATDSARKKFLVELLNLGKYTKAQDIFKELASGMTKQVDKLTTSINTVVTWIDKYSKEDLSLKMLEEELPPLLDLQSKVVLLNKELSNIDDTNKRISKNNTYKNIFYSIDIDSPPTDQEFPLLKEWEIELANISKELLAGAELSKKPTYKTIKCHTCTQDMDNSVMFNRIIAFEEKKSSLKERSLELKELINNANIIRTNKVAYDKKVQEWEKYHALIDPTLADVLLDKDELVGRIEEYSSIINSNSAKNIAIQKRNKIVIEHNSKVNVISQQLVEMREQKNELSNELVVRISELTTMQILVKTFSTTGLLAYKIECLVKDLESLTNEYLSVLSDGRFLLSFVVVSDKLNVVITDNGKDIDIVALSSGERARVNVSTLLAIRKLMQALSNSRTNLLILDETVENLDAEGKEKLVEVLLAEDSLNVLLISHSFTHPLIEKIDIVKKHNISRIVV